LALLSLSHFFFSFDFLGEKMLIGVRPEAQETDTSTHVVVRRGGETVVFCWGGRSLGGGWEILLDGMGYHDE
jgi:hypothetical protein